MKLPGTILVITSHSRSGHIFRFLPSRASVTQTAERRTLDREVSGSKLAFAICFSLRQGNQSALLGDPICWEGSLARALLHSSVKPSTWCACTGGRNCSPGSSKLCRLGVSQAQKAKCREMSARGYALRSVCPQLSVFFQVGLERAPHPKISYSFFSLCNGFIDLKHGGLILESVSTIARYFDFRSCDPGQIRYGGIHRSSVSPRPPCDGTSPASVWLPPRQMPGPRLPYP